MTSPPAELVGAQRPRLHTAPPAASSASGQEAIELARLANLHLDPWQEFALEQGCAETEDGRWAAYEVKIVASRQNGKGAILEARELAGVYLFGEDITHTAHEFATSLDAFARILIDIESCPDLDSRVKRISRSHGEEGIELKNGRRLRFRARTNRAGRGSSGDVVVLDEDMYLPPPAMNALVPTMSARPNPQLWYMGSAPDVAEHAHAHVVAGLRRRALAGGDSSLCYLEWSPEGLEHPEDVAELERAAVAGDPVAVRQLEDAVAAANPGLGIRISREHIDNERRSMLARSWAVERLSVGVWPEPEEAEHVIPPDVWGRLVDYDSGAADPIALAVDIPPDRSRTCIGVAGWRADGRVHVEIVDDAPGTAWVVPRLLELVERWDPCALVMDGRSAATSLVPALAEHDLEVELTTARQMADAAGAFFDDATQDRLRHRGQAELDEAVAAARKRPLADAWAWDRRGSTPITPLVVTSLARWGLTVHGRIVPPPPPLPVPAQGSERATDRAAGTADVMTMGF